MGISLFLFGFAICLYYGLIGYYPWDQSIVFDTAWRIMSGQVPWRDFMTPYAVTPALGQIPFFWVFGVNWFAYLIHAAVLNGLFCVLAWLLLKKLGVPEWIAWLSGLASAVYFNTPIGVPHMDQYAYFCCLASLVALVSVRSSNNPRHRAILGFLAAALLIGAIFSKQVPTLYFLAWFPILLFILNLWRDRFFLTGFASAGILIPAIASLLLGRWRVHWSDFWYYFFELPSMEGANRLRVFHFDTFGNLDQFFPEIAPLAIGTAAWAHFQRRKRDDPIMLLACLSPILLLVSWTSVATTNNNVENSIPFTALCFSMSLYAFWHLFRASKFQTRFLNGIITCLVLLFLVQTISFNESVNQMRRVVLKDMAFLLPAPTGHATDRGGSIDAIQEAPTMPQPLWPMKWCSCYRISSEDITCLLAFFKKTDGNFLVTSHLTILYGLCHRPSIFPASTFYPGVTLPPPGSPQDRRFRALFWQHMETYHVRWMILQEESLLPDYFPELTALARRAKTVRHLGAFTVLELP